MAQLADDIPALLALLAQLTLVLGGLCGPIVIAGLAFSATRPLAFGALTFIIAATVKVITLGLISTLFAQAVAAQLTMPGTDTPLTMGGITGLLFTAAFATLAGFSANSIAGSLVGHGVGGLGLSSFNRPIAVGQAVSKASGGALTLAGAAARAAGGPAGTAAGAMGRAAARVTKSSGNSSPF